MGRLAGNTADTPGKEMALPAPGIASAERERSSLLGCHRPPSSIIGTNERDGVFSKTIRKAGIPLIICVTFGCLMGISCQPLTKTCLLWSIWLLLIAQGLSGSELAGWQLEKAWGRERGCQWGSNPRRGMRLAWSRRASGAYLSPS